MLRDRLDQDLKGAMKSRDQSRVRTLRSIRAALQRKEIERRSEGDPDLTEEDLIAVLHKQAKQREDSIAQFAQAGREDLVMTEREELEIISQYLPTPLSDEEIEEIVCKIIRDLGASTAADLGKVMGNAMSALKGKADGRRINEIAKRLLK